jgi:hypothetical protein
LARGELRAQRVATQQVADQVGGDAPVVGDVAVEQPALRALEHRERHQHHGGEREAGQRFDHHLLAGARAAEHVVGQQQIERQQEDAAQGAGRRNVRQVEQDRHDAVGDDQQVGREPTRGRRPVGPKLQCARAHANRRGQDQRERKHPEMVDREDLVDQPEARNLLLERRHDEQQKEVHRRRVALLPPGAPDQQQRDAHVSPEARDQERAGRQQQPEVAAPAEVFVGHELHEGRPCEPEGQRRQDDHGQESFVVRRHA